MTADSEPFLPGRRFVKYDIIGLLGMGGHAHVYDAHDPFLDRDVALKVIRAPKGSQHNLAKRAQSEARVLVRIDHPNVVKVFDAGATDDGLVYLVMEKLSGRTLREVYQDVGRLSVVEALEIGKQICAGAHAAHELDVIHRDLKPENVFVQADNRVKVLDFGISKVMGYGAHDTTQRHMLHGTVLYMSPEHLQGYGVTRKSDVFSLGTLLYEGLYAHPVLSSPGSELKDLRELRDMRQVIHMQLCEMPPMLHEVDARIFRHVARFVQRAILKNAEQRYETMAEMLEAAHSAWERIEAEEGPGYLVRWRRDLGRATRAAPAPEPSSDTLQAAMRFSTEVPLKRMTQPGGLTPPVPLSVTTPLDQHISGLPYQRTTPVPPHVPTGPATPRPASVRPVVVVPPLGAPAVLPSPAVDHEFSAPVGVQATEALSLTPEQSAMLALAEQVTRTRAHDLTTQPLSDVAAGQGASAAGANSLSVAPVSHASVPAPSPGVSEPGREPAAWRQRLTAPRVLAAGAGLGLLLGIGLSIASLRHHAARAGSAPGAEAAPEPELDSKPSARVAKLASALGEAERAPGSEARAPLPPSAASAANASAANTSAANDVPPPPPPAESAVARLEASSSVGSGQAASTTVKGGKGASSKRAPSPRTKAKPEPASGAGSWLKPEMIHYPDETPPPKPAARDKMPSSGLD